MFERLVFVGLPALPDEVVVVPDCAPDCVVDIVPLVTGTFKVEVTVVLVPSVEVGIVPVPPPMNEASPICELVSC